MEHASYSKRINEVETELRCRMMQKTNRELAKQAGWHESKVSRLYIRDMATMFVLLEKVWETSLIREVARQAVESVLPQKKKSPVAADDSQITMTF